MKICHLTSVHLYNDVRIFHKECMTLTPFHSVSLIAPQAPTKVIEGINVYGVDVNHVKNRYDRMTKLVNLVYKKALEVNADVYHFHDPELIPVGLKLKKINKKVIYDVHEDIPKQILSKQWIPKLIRIPISHFFKLYEKKLSLKFDAIVTASPGLSTKFNGYGCSNVIDLINYPKLQELYFNEIDWESKKEMVCYIGGLSKERGLYEMINTVNNTDYKLIMAGNFIPKSEKEAVVTLNGWGNVDYRGYIDREEVVEIYESSKIGLALLHPLRRYKEWLPVKLFEYMASGIPVIVSNFPLWTDFIEKNNCGICVNPLDTEEIKAAIEYLMNHPKEAEKMGENGRIAVKENYNWEMESKKLIKLYENL